MYKLNTIMAYVSHMVDFRYNYHDKELLQSWIPPMALLVLMESTLTYPKCVDTSGIHTK